MNELCKAILRDCLTKSSKLKNQVFLAGTGEWTELDPEKRDVFENLNIGDYYLDYVYMHELVNEKISDHCGRAYHICQKLIDENGNIILIFDGVEKIDFV